MFRILILIFLMISGGVLGGQAQDTIGVFFDDSGSVNTMTTSSPYELVPFWILLEDASQTSGISSWECEFQTITDGPDPIVTWSLPAGAVNAGTPPQLYVGMSSPLPWAETIILGQGSLYVVEAGQEIALQILPADPPTLVEPPGYGYLVHKPVYGSGDPTSYYPLEISGGCSSKPVAWINPSGVDPDPVLAGAPESLHFGLVPPGTTEMLWFNVTNEGPLDLVGTIHLDMPETVYRHSENAYTDQSTTFRLGSGEELDLYIKHQPETANGYSGHMFLEYCGIVDTVQLETGEPIIDCWVSQYLHDFGPVYATRTRTLNMSVGNNGNVPLDARPRLSAGCSEFSWEVPNPLTNPSELLPGEIMVLHVTYAPQDAIDDSCTLSFGDDCRSILLMGQLGFFEMVVDPVSVNEQIVAGSTNTLTMTVQNTGNLFYSYGLYPRWNNQSGGKSGGVTPPDAGGPDGFGHQWMDSDEPGGPIFDWVDISATGNIALEYGNDSGTTKPIGFPFSYYGLQFTEFRVCTNGFLTFHSGYDSPNNQPFPWTGASDMLAPFWTDLNLDRGGTIYYEVVDGNLVVMFDQVMPSAGSDGTGPYTFEVILSPSGKITMQYLSMPGLPTNYTVGIQESVQDEYLGLNIAYNTPYLRDNLAIEITGALPWLSTNPRSGFFDGGESAEVVVTLDSRNMALGLHEARIVVSGYRNTYDDLPVIEVPVTLEVVSVSSANEPELPRTVALAQNAPNPFNPQTTIAFDLPKQTLVRLHVFDMSGRLVKALVDDEVCGPGRNEKIWAGRDETGRLVSSGTYFYRLEAGEYSETRRMTLLK